MNVDSSLGFNYRFARFVKEDNSIRNDRLWWSCRVAVRPDNRRRAPDTFQQFQIISHAEISLENAVFSCVQAADYLDCPVKDTGRTV
jgi:hypothetical protein